MLPLSLEQLIQELSKLPSIGRKTAKRLAFSILEKPDREAHHLAEAIVQAKQNISSCNICYGLSEETVCSICANPKRNQDIICIVEEPKNIYTIEKGGFYFGVYHVLHGAISPIHGVSPDHLKIRELESRIQNTAPKEVIIATNPTIEGEATAHYLTDLLQDRVNIISRIARGIPSGSDMEFADSVTLTRAFEGRTDYFRSQ
jgi:recombination protein RecR